MVEKTADDTSVSAGSAIGFTVKTTNNGPGTATGVTLNDPLPNGVDWTIDPANTDCQITGTGDDQVLSCDFGNLADDASETVHVTATTSFSACTTYDNEATASATNAPDAKDDASITCLKPAVVVEKTADAATVDAGDPIGFTVKTTNNGPGTRDGGDAERPAAQRRRLDDRPGQHRLRRSPAPATTRSSAATSATSPTTQARPSTSPRPPRSAPAPPTTTRPPPPPTNHPNAKDDASITCNDARPDDREDRRQDDRRRR